ncbi:hypothetical protein PAXRUDRAFT_830418 [Paxillus rubicundulus Ve08.2h10]|uniref:Uncharacterized protein n=1 Tax=Paxillus rubicundulus Ve08.2h10 TaxID=930991 RepID=A0A0D0DYX5_9AGAM|nr:hypothetical protein PAXRUDRAFT_830418 [Paxillus rubicundulus Ve08.2h10]
MDTARGQSGTPAHPTRSPSTWHEGKSYREVNLKDDISSSSHVVATVVSRDSLRFPGVFVATHLFLVSVVAFSGIIRRDS